MRIILASGSPRRKELLQMITTDFEVIVSEADETITKNKPDEITMELATVKADAVASSIFENETNDFLVIGSDTVVAVDDQILGKPKDKEDARTMIKSISGRGHYVYTGVSLIGRVNGEKIKKSFSDGTEVLVKELSEEEIEAYISTKEPYDKAGAYGIQGLFGKHVEGIRGDYNNVVGLPVHKLYEAMKEYL